MAELYECPVEGCDHSTIQDFLSTVDWGLSSQKKKPLDYIGYQ